MLHLMLVYLFVSNCTLIKQDGPDYTLQDNLKVCFASRQICVSVQLCLSPHSREFWYRPAFFFSPLFLQIMEINGQNFENISLSKAVDILRNNTHLSLTVKTNIFGEWSQSFCSLWIEFICTLFIWAFALFVPLSVKSSKSSWAGLCMKRKMASHTFPRSRRKKAIASPSLTYLEIWSSRQTTRARERWRPTPCQEGETRSGRCWRRHASVYCHPNLSGKCFTQRGCL